MVPNHTYSPHRKQSWEELWADYKTELENSITKKADHINFNQYAAQYYWFTQNKTANGKIKGQVYHFSFPSVVCFIYELLNNKQQLMCLNNTDEETTSNIENITIKENTEQVAETAEIPKTAPQNPAKCPEKTRQKVAETV